MPNQLARSAAGAAAAIVGVAVLTAVLVPARHHLSVATAGLVLVMPVVGGVAVGGLWAGVVAVSAGFLAYDFFFIPPYGTLSVGGGQNWVALVVYVVVMLVVARVVAYLQRARTEARRHEDDTRRLYLLSDLLIGEQATGELLETIVATIRQAFGARWAAVLLPVEEAAPDHLAVAATAGDTPGPGELAALTPLPGRPESMRPTTPEGGTATAVVRLVLTALGRPVGMVVLAGASFDRHGWDLLRTYANQAALAIERTQLAEKARRIERLEEADRWRDALIGAVSHDLRTPLASVKTAVSTLRRGSSTLGRADTEDLLELIEDRADALDRLVANLLDMTRIQDGRLQLRREITPVAEVVEASLHAAAGALAGLAVTVAVPDDVPPVDVDTVLMVQVLANLLDNAAHHNGPAEPVEVAAATAGPMVELSVRDHGPGVPADDRQRVFQMFNRVSGSGRAGLGLTIAKAFVEANGGRIWVEDAPGGGARFVVALPAATLPAESLDWSLAEQAGAPAVP